MGEESPPAPEGSVPGGALAPWNLGELPEPPRAGWRLWIGLLGPGVVLAGTSIATGEWLFGPAVTAQYGGSILWLATLSIVFQVFANLLMMRYTLWCGEPIIVGGFRTAPGPVLWIFVYLILELASIWPYNASNTAVPLAASILGRLPGAGSGDRALVKGLGVAIFLLSFVPLIFGGTVYRMLEKIMTAKLVLVLGYLSLVVILMVSGKVVLEVASGFFRFGTVPLRAETVVAGRHFVITALSGAGGGEEESYCLKGSLRRDGGAIDFAEFVAVRAGRPQVFKEESAVPADLSAPLASLLERARTSARPGRFLIESRGERGSARRVNLAAEGRIDGDRRWVAEQIALTERDGAGLPAGAPARFQSLDAVPEPARSRLRELLENQGLERVNLAGYLVERGELPPLDWTLLLAFAAVAGAGGLSNTLFSNYARDKGWGMGRHVGAIPSAIGGRDIQLSHVGKVFRLDGASLGKWRGWLRHIFRDQAVIWAAASFLGMAFPCMMSLEFIRNATVSDHAVAAMAAEGMAERFPAWSGLFWTLTLLCGFLILAPGQVSVGDQIARRWTDIIWTASARARRLRENQVKVIYYSILSVYGVWGFVLLVAFNPLQIAKIGTNLNNVAMGVTALHAVYVNRTLLPRELRPGPLLEAGAVLCGIFFLGMAGVAAWVFWR